MNAAKGLVGKIREVGSEGGAGLDQGALVQSLAIDERAVEVPGHRPKDAHDAFGPGRRGYRRYREIYRRLAQRPGPNAS